MSATWSYAATGLTLTIVGLAVGQQMISPLNRPNFFRSGLGLWAFSFSGLLMTILMFFFGFRLFWDNGLWGLLQLLVVSLLSGVIANTSVRHSGLTPLVCCGLAVAQAIKIF